jgi:hypothetical protein
MGQTGWITCDNEISRQLSTAGREPTIRTTPFTSYCLYWRSLPVGFREALPSSGLDEAQ